MTSKTKKGKGRSSLSTSSTTTKGRRVDAPRRASRSEGRAAGEGASRERPLASKKRRAPQAEETQKSEPRAAGRARAEEPAAERRSLTPRPRRLGERSRGAAESAPTLSTLPRRRGGAPPADPEPAKPAEKKPPRAAAREVEPELESQVSPASSSPATFSEPEPDSDPHLSSEDLPLDSTSEDIGLLGIGSRMYPPDLDFELFEQQHEVDLPPVDDPSVEARIAEIEARLDGLMASSELGTVHDLPVAGAPRQAPSSEAVDAARELLESDYYRKKWGRGALREQEGGVDQFGYDPSYEERLRPGLEFLFKYYFRVEVEGIEHIPDRGRAVVVANHSGALPFDGAMLREAARLHHPARRDLRWLAEDFSFYLPFIGVTMNRIGAVRACQENAQRLLEAEHVVAVFPEGAEGLKKLYKERYQLQRFGRGGFVRLALKTRSPIIPCAVIGAEETNPVLYRFDNLSKLIGLDYLPITPTFPLLGPLGLLPAPTKWRLLFGEPISVDDYGPSAADDHVLVGRLSERVRSTINGLIDSGLRKRKSLWF